MENKVQQIEILGHTVNYISNTNSLIDPETIEEAIELGDKSGNLYKAYDLTLTPIGKWWITDWEEIATELYNELKFAYHNIYTDSSAKDALYEKLKMYEDGKGK